LETSSEGTAAYVQTEHGSHAWITGRRSQRGLVLRAAVKRTLDILLSAVILVAMVPFVVLLCLAIVIESRGPLLYRAERVGRHGQVFRMLKFRKMRSDSSGRRLTTRNDERLTSVGAFLARSKLDELPQLVNVLRGDMSLVGPRPEDPSFVIRRRADYDGILRVRPGITGLSQIAFADESAILSEVDPLGHYVDGILPQKCALDRLYADARSLRLDLRILLWTFVAIVVKRPVAVDRASGRMRLRRRPPVPAGAPARSTSDLVQEECG
jgi:lipopolysaccharide/colanic/teichoic acid biosynthesis glycosyltransferase